MRLVLSSVVPFLLVTSTSVRRVSLSDANQPRDSAATLVRSQNPERIPWKGDLLTGYDWQGPRPGAAVPIIAVLHPVTMLHFTNQITASAAIAALDAMTSSYRDPKAARRERHWTLLSMPVPGTLSHFFPEFVVRAIPPVRFLPCDV